MSMLTTVPHDCPECGHQILVDYEAQPERVQCENCKSWADVDYDAEMVDRAWKDRTKLVRLEWVQELRRKEDKP